MYVYVCEIYILVFLGHVMYVCLCVVYVCEFCGWSGGMYVCGGLLINIFLFFLKCPQFLSPPVHVPLCSEAVFLKHKAELAYPCSS